MTHLYSCRIAIYPLILTYCSQVFALFSKKARGYCGFAPQMRQRRLVVLRIRLIPQCSRPLWTSRSLLFGLSLVLFNCFWYSGLWCFRQRFQLFPHYRAQMQGSSTMQLYQVSWFSLSCCPPAWIFEFSIPKADHPSPEFSSSSNHTHPGGLLAPALGSSWFSNFLLAASSGRWVVTSLSFWPCKVHVHLAGLFLYIKQSHQFLSWYCPISFICLPTDYGFRAQDSLLPSPFISKTSGFRYWSGSCARHYLPIQSFFIWGLIFPFFAVIQSKSAPSCRALLFQYVFWKSTILRLFVDWEIQLGDLCLKGLRFCYVGLALFGDGIGIQLFFASISHQLSHFTFSVVQGLEKATPIAGLFVLLFICIVLSYLVQLQLDERGQSLTASGPWPSSQLPILTWFSQVCRFDPACLFQPSFSRAFRFQRVQQFVEAAGWCLSNSQALYTAPLSFLHAPRF